MPKGQYDHSMLRPDLTGQVFTRWTVQYLSDKHGAKGQAYWWCLCECGVMREVIASSLRGGVSTSCGCRNSDLVVERQTTHGDTRSAEYRVWAAMWQRCTNPKQRSYARYGARGIKVCRRWEESYEAFLEDMGRKPSPAHSLDRINYDGNYEPNNCRWATDTEQARNTVRNRLLTYEGETLTMAEWSERKGFAYQLVNTRINILHWSVEKALTTPHRTLSKRGKPLPPA